MIGRPRSGRTMTGTPRVVIEAGWLVTMAPTAGAVRSGAVAVEDGRIVAVGRAGEVHGEEVWRFPRHVILPGLVNAHTHVAGAVFRGLLEDREDSFHGFALPMERHLDPEAILVLSRLGIAEVLLAGCTTFNDMFHHAAETARAAAEAGVRAQVAQKTYDADLPGIGRGRREYSLDRGMRKLAENVSLYEEWQGSADGRIGVRFGAHAADTCSPELLKEIVAAVDARGAGIHTHVAQGLAEYEYLRDRYGKGSVEFLDDNGVLGTSTVAVHLVHTDATGIELLRRTDTPMAHCPGNVLKSAGQLGPMEQIYAAGIRVGWGTDWITMDPWDAMRAGIAGHRQQRGARDVLSAQEALRYFTLGSAEALGLADRIGSLEIGKRADLILVDVDQPHLAPLSEPVGVLVYNASGRDVTHVMVDGRFVVMDRRLAYADAREIVRDAQAVAERVWSSSTGS
jgi:5-methylthioadenosine/S-adenosylhomocysteine deaminase